MTRWLTLRFHSPLIEPYGRISRIRLSFEVGAEQRRPLPLGEAGLAGPAVEQPMLLLLAVPAADRQAAEPALAVVRAVRGAVGRADLCDGPQTRSKGRMTKVEQRIIFGTAVAAGTALASSASSRAVSTSCVERENGTDRNRNARKARKSCCFPKGWSVRQAITYFTTYSDNFCWAVRTLRGKTEGGNWRCQTPAIVAGLADHVWPLSEWLTLPAVHQKEATRLWRRLPR